MAAVSPGANASGARCFRLFVATKISAMTTATAATIPMIRAGLEVLYSTWMGWVTSMERTSHSSVFPSSETDVALCDTGLAGSVTRTTKDPPIVFSQEAVSAKSA